MRSTIVPTLLLLFTAAFTTPAQVSTPEPAKSPEPAKTVSSGSQTANASGYTRPNADERFKRYVNGMFGPMALAKTAASAGWSTWRNSPEEWGDQWEGFGRRVASGMGKSVIKHTTMYALDESFKLDSHYYRSKKRDAGSKIKNALISPFTARKPNGKRVFGFPRIVGTYTASIVAAEMWYPARYDYKNGLKSGTTSLAFTAAFNLVKEFIWKK